jgi:hypothetical protein
VLRRVSLGTLSASLSSVSRVSAPSARVEILRRDRLDGEPAARPHTVLALEVWVAYELRRAGLDPDAVWRAWRDSNPRPAA